MALLPTSIPTSLDQLNPFSTGQTVDEQAPSLLIVELTGQQRSIELKGWSLPRRPVSFGKGVQRTRKTTYAGNPQSTQQVLGPEETDCTFSGFWKSRFVAGTVVQSGFPREVTRASDLVEYFDSMRKAGQVVRLRWGDVARNGIIVGFEATYHRTQDIEWELELEWQSQGEVAVKVPRPKLSAPGLLDALNKLSEILALGPTFLLPDVNAIVVTAIADTRRTVGQIFDAVRQIAKIGRLPADAVASLTTNSESLRLQMLETINFIAETPVTTVAAARAGRAASDKLEAEEWRREASFEWMALLDSIDLQVKQIEARSSPPPLRTVTAKQGDTTYSISLANYGTPDLAGFLAEVNFLDSPVIQPGTVIVIPPKPDQLAVT